MRHTLFLATVIAALMATTALQASPNLVQNESFQTAGTPPNVTRSGGGFASTDATGVDPHNLVGYAAAQNWLTWTGQVGGRVRTREEPSELYGPGRFMLHVQVFNGPGIAGIDQVFLPIHKGPRHADFCALVKVVSGTMGLGANDEGNGTFTTPLVGATGNWVAIHGSSSTPPVNQVFLYAGSPDADFFVQNVVLTADPIPAKSCFVPQQVPNALGERLTKPDPYPWTVHPEQQGGQGSASGFYDNMTPARSTPVVGNPNPTQTEEHEGGHDHGGGDKGGGKGAPNTLPVTNQIQQQQPATSQQ